MEGKAENHGRKLNPTVPEPRLILDSVELGEPTNSSDCVSIRTEILRLIKMSPMRLGLKSLLFLVILSVVIIGIFHHTKMSQLIRSPMSS